MNKFDWALMEQIARRMHGAIASMNPKRRQGENAIDAGSISIEPSGDDGDLVEIAETTTVGSGTRDEPPTMDYRVICKVSDNGIPLATMYVAAHSYPDRPELTAVRLMFDNVLDAIAEDILLNDGMEQPLPDANNLENTGEKF